MPNSWKRTGHKAHHDLEAAAYLEAHRAYLDGSIPGRDHVHRGMQGMDLDVLLHHLA